MNRRYERLLATGRRKITRDDGEDIYLVVIDEYAYYSATIGKKQDREEFAALARDLIARGRAAGVILILATQRPSHQIIDPSMRDLFAYRLAFRCTTDSSSDVVLGQGWAGKNYTAAEIDPLARGVAWLLSETGVPRRIKTAWLDDDTTSSTWPPTPPGSAARTRPHDRHHRPQPPGRPQHRPARTGPEHCQESVDTQTGCGRSSRTTPTPRSPTASCAPTRAASPAATSNPSPLMTRLADDIDAAIGEAVTGLRGFGYSWADIGYPARRHPPGRPATLGSPLIGTAATVPLTPGLDTGPGMGASADDTPPSIGWADFLAAEHQHTATGGCTHPSGCAAASTPSTWPPANCAPVYDTTTEPGGVLLTSCGNRRETVCPACSAVYKRDARQLVRAGLSGGKGVPETITAHPCVFATFTAPSFGPVHARRMRGKTVLPCRPRRDAKARRCPHGRDISCPARHGEHDPRLGRALCGDCYDYTAAVLFNAYAGRPVAPVHHLPAPPPRPPGRAHPESAPRHWSRIRYVKVAEYQARGVVHFHAVIRLDAPGDDYQPPPPAFTTDLLCRRHRPGRRRRHRAHRPRAIRPAGPVTLRFGTQVDTRPIRHGDDLPGTGRKLSVQAVGNYIAKYATKALDAPGLPDRPLRSGHDIDGAALPLATTGG